MGNLDCRRQPSFFLAALSRCAAALSCSRPSRAVETASVSYKHLQDVLLRLFDGKARNPKLFSVIKVGWRVRFGVKIKIVATTLESNVSGSNAV